MNNFKALYDDSIIPTRSTIASAGYDLYMHDESIRIAPNQAVLIKTGVTAEIDPSCALLICSRSGLALKHNVFVLNAPGIVDADYYPNEIGVILYNANQQSIEFKKGDRIAQAMITKYFVANNEVTPNQERKGGFGSTGTN